MIFFLASRDQAGGLLLNVAVSWGASLGVLAFLSSFPRLGELGQLPSAPNKKPYPPEHGRSYGHEIDAAEYPKASFPRDFALDCPIWASIHPAGHDQNCLWVRLWCETKARVP